MYHLPQVHASYFSLSTSHAPSRKYSGKKVALKALVVCYITCDCNVGSGYSCNMISKDFRVIGSILV